MDDSKYADKLNSEKRQEFEKRHRQNQRQRVIVESNEFSFDDFVLLLIVIITLLLCDILGSAFWSFLII